MQSNPYHGARFFIAGIVTTQELPLWHSTLTLQCGGTRSDDNFMASTAMAEFQDESGTMRIPHGYNMESHGIDTLGTDSADTYVGGPPLAYKFLTDSQQTDMYTLLGGTTHTRICASPDLCTICGLHNDLRSICNSITVTNTREMVQMQPAKQQTTTTDETTIDRN